MDFKIVIYVEPLSNCNKKVSRLFPIQKNELYNILKVTRNLTMGTHKKWLTPSGKMLNNL